MYASRSAANRANGLECAFIPGQTKPAIGGTGAPVCLRVTNDPEFRWFPAGPAGHGGAFCWFGRGPVVRRALLVDAGSGRDRGAVAAAVLRHREPLRRPR